MALQTNNGANYARFGTNARICSGRSFTVEAWINASSFPADAGDGGGFNVIVGGQTSAPAGWEFGYQSYTGTLYLGWTNNGTNYYGYGIPALGDTVAVPVPTGRWVHVAALYDASTATYRLAVDGVVKDRSPALTALAAATAALGIRQSYDNAGYSFTGAIARVRLYEGVITGQQLQRSMRSVTVPPELRRALLADVPLRRELTLVVRDEGPASLGTATQTGTVTQAADPDTALALRRLRAVRAPSGTSATVFLTPASMALFAPRPDLSSDAALALPPSYGAAHLPPPALSSGAALALSPVAVSPHAAPPAISSGAALALTPHSLPSHAVAPALSGGAAVDLAAAALVSHVLPPSLAAGVAIVLTPAAVTMVAPLLTASAGASVELTLAAAPLAAHAPAPSLSAGAALALAPAQAGLHTPPPSLAAGAVLSLAPAGMAAHGVAPALSAGAALTLTLSGLALFTLPIVGSGSAVVDVGVAAPAAPLALLAPAPALSAGVSLVLAPVGLATHTPPLSLAGGAAVALGPASLDIVARALGLSSDALLSLPPGSLVLVAPAWALHGGGAVAARLILAIRADRRVYLIPAVARRVVVAADRRVYRVPSDQEVLVSAQQVPVFELPSIRNGELLDFDFDFTAWLADDGRVTGDTLDGSHPASWNLHGLTKDSQSQTTTTARVWIAPTGVTTGRSYPIDCTVTTAQGRVVTKSAILRVVAMH